MEETTAFTSRMNCISACSAFGFFRLERQSLEMSVHIPVHSNPMEEHEYPPTRSRIHAPPSTMVCFTQNSKVFLQGLVTNVSRKVLPSSPWKISCISWLHPCLNDVKHLKSEMLYLTDNHKMQWIENNNSETWFILDLDAHFSITTQPQ